MSAKDIPYMKAVEQEYSKLVAADQFELIAFPPQATHIVSIENLTIEVKIKHKITDERVHEFIIWSRRKGFLGFGGMCCSAFKLTAENKREGYQIYDFKELD